MNPISMNWYADPESRVYHNKLFMYVTNSLPFEEQKNLDLVVTEDLCDYRTIRNILQMDTYQGANFAIWAPTVIEQENKYYIIFAANDIHSEEEIGGLYLGVCDTPYGPFCNVFADGRPLVNAIRFGAQPIDAHLFKDDDGSVYLYYGGWGHMVVCKMNDQMNGFEPLSADSQDLFREITPSEYTEAPFVMKIAGKYHLMYSGGSWLEDSYCVRAAVSESPLGPFSYYGDVLRTAELADAPGHNSAFLWQGEYYTAYHRRTPGEEDYNHRRLCIDRLPITDGKLGKVTMT